MAAMLIFHYHLFIHLFICFVQRATWHKCHSDLIRQWVILLAGQDRIKTALCQLCSILYNYLCDSKVRDVIFKTERVSCLAIKPYSEFRCHWTYPGTFTPFTMLYVHYDPDNNNKWWNKWYAYVDNELFLLVIISLSDMLPLKLFYTSLPLCSEVYVQSIRDVDVMATKGFQLPVIRSIRGKDDCLFNIHICLKKKFIQWKNLPHRF